jgi:hypothetical protein
MGLKIVSNRRYTVPKQKCVMGSNVVKVIPFFKLIHSFFFFLQAEVGCLLWYVTRRLVRNLRVDMISSSQRRRHSAVATPSSSRPAALVPRAALLLPLDLLPWYSIK